MSADLARGLAEFLGAGNRSVTVTNVEYLSAGARRRNVAFEADLGGGTRRLVATIVPGAIELVPVDVEAAVRELARTHGVPVPPVVAICTEAGYVGGPFVVSERIDGETVPRKVLRLAEASGLGERVAEQLGEAMGRLHAIDPAAAPARLPAAAADPERQLVEAAAQVRALLPDRPVFALALRWLERHCPPAPPRTALLHTDLRNGNIVVGPDGLRAVLDWEGAQRQGDPMRDVAWPALRMWRFRADDREFGGLAGREAFLRGYHRGGGSFDEDRFRWWKAMCTLGWGVGLAGQAAAHLDGSVRDIVMAASGRRVSEIEWDLLMQIRPTAKG
ncbi:phosphotransferase family protein [Nocardia implantans]|uniref:Phosphotransferase family protein n=1 Tax=Nocardia implantans TaxID=3108168 RepID=A0ABU6APK0_9NOCA|nr:MULTISPECIES: phosphotransferase family protein [unclassified Nocardia]MBF6189655.1 phosphotransferase family protein [Nocardia beijingensis]MEA3527117.1 phosphotransferase family protein [Nocardia sp. CDC192]MEB3509305.1 phosphotransferase family protein [Nocardia sp. CDC186]